MIFLRSAQIRLKARETGTIRMTTPTGNTGSPVLRNLLAAGEKTGAVAPDPAELRPEIREQIEMTSGSSDDIQRFERHANIVGHRKELEKVERDLNRAIQAILDGVPDAQLKDKIAGLEARKVEPVGLLASSEALLQQNRHLADIAVRPNVRFAARSGASGRAISCV
jgi:hypothetical protein